MLDSYALYGGCATADTAVVLLGKDRDIDPSDTSDSPSIVFAFKDGDVSALQIDWHVAAVAYAGRPNHQLYCVGQRGRLRVIGSSDYEEAIEGRFDPPLTRGVLIGASIIGRSLYTVGMGRQVFRRSLDQGGIRGSWAEIGAAIAADPRQPGPQALTAIGGTAEHDLAASGWNGELFNYDGQAWRKRDLPTDADLHALACDGDGIFVVAGQHGVALIGRDDRWAVLINEADKADIWSVAHFNNSFWLATLRGVLKVEEDTIVPITLEADLISGALTANDRRLWSIGSDHVHWTEDGQNWSRLSF
jgi:hypothetical protein